MSEPATPKELEAAGYHLGLGFMRAVAEQTKNFSNLAPSDGRPPAASPSTRKGAGPGRDERRRK